MTTRPALVRGTLLAVSLLVGACTRVAREPRAATLKEAYAPAFRVGTAVNEAIVLGTDAASRRIVLQQFDAITAENVLKAERVNPRPGVYEFGPADAFVAFG